MEIRYQCKGSDCQISNSTRNQLVVTDNELIEFVDAENSERQNIISIIKDPDKQKEIKQLISQKRCPFCDNELVEAIEPPKPVNKKLLMIIGSSLAGVVIIVLFLIFNPFSNNKADSQTKAQVSEPAATEAPATEPVSTPPVTSDEPAKPAAASNVPVNNSSTGTNSNTIKYQNGNSYTGDIKNGKPDGVGTYYFKVKEVVSKRDPQNRTGEPGDVLQGLWKDGNFVNGKLFDSQGKVKEVLILGTN